MSSDELRPLPLTVGDHVALDFLNTIATPSTTQVEWLTNGYDLLDWLKFVGAIEETVAAGLRDRGKELDAVAEEARGLREWFRAFVKQHAGRRLAVSSIRELEPLNRLLAEDSTYQQVVVAPRKRAQGEGTPTQPLQWSQQRRWDRPRLLLQPIAAAMGDLACNADFRLVRACEGVGCTLMFYDRTKGHARRWCTMSVCGNRAKAAAHRARVRAEKH